MRVLPKNRWFFVLGTLCFVLCTSSCRPRGVLSSRQMREVLYDLHYTEAVLQVSGYNYGHDEAVSRYYYETLRRHDITQAQFDSSLVWYTDHPERFNKIYPKVLVMLEEQGKLTDAENETLRQERIAEAQQLAAARRAAAKQIKFGDWYPGQLERFVRGIPFYWPYLLPQEAIVIPFDKKNSEKS